MKFIGVDVAAAVPPPYMPPGVPGFVTVTGTVPAFMIAEAGIVVISLAALTRVVVWDAPLKLMTAAEPKFVPSTSNTKLELPAITLLGFSWAIAGIVPGCAGMVDLE